jgi:hypothetical protein
VPRPQQSVLPVDSSRAGSVGWRTDEPATGTCCATTIERLWKDLHDNVTRNHRCPTLEALMEEVEAWLDRPPDERTGVGLRSA